MIRYHALDKCFRNRVNKYFIEDLIEECSLAIKDLEPNSNGISKRTVQYDIRFMESEQGWSVPLERHFEEKKVYYRYSDPDFSINNQPLNESEATQLKSALQVLSRFKGAADFSWVEEIAAKLEHELKLKDTEKQVMSFDHNEFLKGLHFLGDLFNAIVYKKSLKIIYQSFKSDKASEIVFHPYFLKQYNKRWFLFGKNNQYPGITNLALDRILSFSDHNIKYIENNEVDFESYFDDIIGVTLHQDEELTKIEIWASNDIAPYIKTKPLHGSQKRISENEDGYTFSIEIIPNMEFEQLILSYGEKVKVLSPDNVVSRIKLMVHGCLKNYK